MTNVTKQLTIKFFGALFFFMGLTLLTTGGHAHAIINNNGQIPTAIRNVYEPNGNNCAPHRYGQDVWVSKRFDPTNLNPVVITQGTDSVDLWFNELTSICNNALTTWPTDTSGPIAGLFRDKAATKYGIVGFGASYGTTTNLNGTSIDLTTYNEAYLFNTRYVIMPVASGFTFPQHADFTLSGLASLPVGIKTITILAQVREIHWLTNNTFKCVSTDTPASSLIDPTCAPLVQTYDVYLDVQPKIDNIPTLTVTPTCTGITAVGDDIDYPGWGDHISIDGFPSGAPNTVITTNAATNTVTYSPPTIGQPLSYRIWNLKPDGNYDSTKDFTVVYAWTPPPGCPADLFTTTTNSIVNLDNDETPTTATFDGTVQTNGLAVNGITAKRTFYVIYAGGPGTRVPITPLPSSLDDPVNTVPANPDALTTVNKGLAGLGLKAGDVVCQSIITDPGSGTADKVTHAIVTAGAASAEKTTCTPIVAHPLVSFTGGDVSAGNGVGAGCATNSNAEIKAFNKGSAGSYDGSGVSLAAYATGKITGFKSSLLTFPPSPTTLAFANTGNGLNNNGAITAAGDFGGKFGTAKCITNYYAISNAATSGVTKVSGSPYVLHAGTHYKEVISVTGDLVIDGDILLDLTPRNSISELPYFWVIVSGNIYITNGVKKIEGIYIAQNTAANKGIINTCAKATAPYDYNANDLYANCGGGDSTKRLTINGAFLAKQVKLNRSYGALSLGSGQAAERFNFGPLFYMNSPDVFNTTITNPNAGKFDAHTTLPPVL